MLDLVVAGGTVVSEAGLSRADVGVEDGRVVALGERLGRARRVVRADGNLVLPGAIDPHVHLQLRVSGTVSADDFFTGTRAAALGGVTTVIDFADQRPGQSLREAVTARRREADPAVVIDYGLHGQVGDVDRAEAELEEVVAGGVTSFKFFMLRKEGVLLSDADLFRLLRAGARVGGLVTVHAENAALVERLGAELRAHGDDTAAALGRWRPWYVEAEAVNRALIVAEAAGGALYVVHVSTGQGAAAVAAARARGVLAYGETCPQYLLLTDDRLAGPDGHLYTCTPPLRPEGHGAMLWQALAEGWLQTVGSDHCPFPSTEKAAAKADPGRMPYGLAGVETLLPLMHSEGVVAGRLSLPRLCALVAGNPARVFGLWPRKGGVHVGADADLVVLDPRRRLTLGPRWLHSTVDYTPYRGWRVAGWPEATIARGRVVASGGKFHGRRGDGEFLAREAHGRTRVV